MIKFAKTLYWVIFVLLLLWIIPSTLHFAMTSSQEKDFILYSSVTGDFEIKSKERGKDAYFDSILPFFYFRQLVADGRMPDSVNGTHVTPADIQRTNFNFSSHPMDINTFQIGVYPLLESLSGRVDLKYPDDLFRITSSRIEFIDNSTNKVNEKKSEMFTKVFIRKNFRFPAKKISGNPNIRKEYDNGYMITDSDGHLFNLKMVHSRPYLRPIDVPDSISIKHMFVTEFRNRSMLAFFTDDKNQLYVITLPDYSITHVEIPSFDPETQQINIIGNMLDWTVKITSSDRVEYYAVSASDCRLIKEYIPETKEGLKFFGLRFTSPNTKSVFPTFTSR